MDPKELKKMLEDALADVKALREQNEQHEKTIADLSEQFKGYKAEDNKEKMDEILDELADLQSKMKKPAAAITDDVDRAKAFKELAGKAIGAAFKEAQSKGLKEISFESIYDHATDQFKALNITTPAQGGLAVAEVLSRDVLEYAREYSPILLQVGRKANMTRSFREMVLISYPTVAKGIENVAGTAFTETDTQTYAEVRSKEFKLYAKPRITDEAMYGTDIDIYGHLVELLGVEVAIYLAAQVLYGDGADKNCRGILSSNRLQTATAGGESWKPTLGAGARGADYFPAKASGVAGKLGADDKAIVDFIIDVVNEHPTMHLQGSAWHMNRKTRGVLEKVRDGFDRPIFRMSYSDDGGSRLMLNGFPVIIDDTLPDIADGACPIIFGRLDRAFAINDGDIDKLIVDPYSVDACTVLKYHKEMFEMMQRSDAVKMIMTMVKPT